MTGFKKIMKQAGRIIIILLASVCLGMINIFPTFTPMRKEDTTEWVAEVPHDEDDPPGESLVN